MLDASYECLTSNIAVTFITTAMESSPLEVRSIVFVPRSGGSVSGWRALTPNNRLQWTGCDAIRGAAGAGCIRVRPGPCSSAGPGGRGTLSLGSEPPRWRLVHPLSKDGGE